MSQKTRVANSRVAGTITDLEEKVNTMEIEKNQKRINDLDSLSKKTLVENEH